MAPSPSNRHKVEINDRIKEKYSSGLSQSEIAELIERGIPDIFRWEDDDLALRVAAQHSRLNFDKMSSQEAAAFSDIIENKTSVALFLHVRNKMLQLWHLEPNVELTKESAYNEIMVPYNSDRGLIRRVHAFLERYGYINFGVYHKISASPCHLKKKIIVIGAGPSGMCATRQLKSFGFDVVLLEGRKRVGGRVHTHTAERTSHKIELGAMVLTGICGNPLMTLTRQYPVRLDKLNSSNCTIYDVKGRAIVRRKDQLVEEAFNRVGDIASYIVHEKGMDKIDGQNIDVETAYDNIICLMELRLQKRRVKYYRTYEEMVTKLKDVHDEMIIYKKSVEMIHEKIKEVEDTPLSQFSSRLERDIIRKCYKRDLYSAIKQYDLMVTRKKSIEGAIANLKKMEPNDVYMNGYDRRVFDFHLANLEYANGTCLRNLSLKYWDQDDEHELPGSHMTVRDGLSSLFAKLIGPAEVLCERTVKKIEYDEKGVTVYADFVEEDGVDEEGQRKLKITRDEYHGDAVLCTIPLGVLKKSIDNDSPYGPEFSPPLPQSKIDAINKVGYGNLNKVVLCFENVFWEDGVHFFGNLTSDFNVGSEARGELYMFVAQTGKPVLTGLLAGASAFFDLSRETIVARAMSILSTIFGNLCPSSPKEAIVTIWHKDPFSFGCYSYMGRDATADDYDILAEPVRSHSINGQYNGPQRVFFAGEHTCRNYPATVHGAFLSGLREAGRITDTLTGCPYATPENDVVSIDDDDDDCIVVDKKEESPDGILPNGHSNGSTMNGSNGHNNQRMEH